MDVFRHRLAREFRMLGEDERETLRAASVVTIKALSAAAVANLLDIDLLETEARLDQLADRRQWLMRLEGRLWPDSTLAQAYGFRLVPYRNFLCAMLPLGTRQQLHQRHARRLEFAFAGKLELVAQNLAYHFEQGGAPELASRYCGDSSHQRSRREDRVVRMQLAPDFHPSSPVLDV